MTAFYPSGGKFPDFAITALVHRPARRVACEQAPPAPSALMFFAGLAVVDGELVTTIDRFAALALRGRSGPPRSYAGCYSAVVRSGGVHHVVNDLFGLCSLFHFNDGRRVIVSNRAHLVSKLLHAAGVARRPDVDAIAAATSSAHPLFSHPCSHRTFLSGLSICPVDSTVSLSVDGTLRLDMKREHFTDPGATRYDELIDIAADEIRSNVAAVVRSRAFSTRVIDLSGGKDSRMVFAAAVGQGLLRDCEVRVLDFPTAGDLAAGAAIAGSSGARFASTVSHRVYSRSSRFVSGFWRSISTGTSHDVGVSNHPAMWQSDTVRLNGGCGEVYRHAKLEQRLADALFRPERFRRVFRPGIAPSLASATLDSLRGAVLSLPGWSTDEKLRNHYLYFRNRFHFGNPALNEWNGYVPFSPLQSAALLLASRLLLPHDRARGRAVFDVTARMMPALVGVPFSDGSRWPADFFDRLRVSLRAGRMPPFTNAIERSHCEAESTRRATLMARVERVDRIGASVPMTMLHDAREVLLALREADAALAGVLDRRFVEWFEAASAASPVGCSTTTASKILAAFDLCLDTDMHALDLSSLPHGESYRLDGLGAVALFALR